MLIDLNETQFAAIVAAVNTLRAAQNDDQDARQAWDDLMVGLEKAKAESAELHLLRRTLNSFPYSGSLMGAPTNTPMNVHAALDALSRVIRTESERSDRIRMQLARFQDQQTAIRDFLGLPDPDNG